jgi:hypothetical protein
MGRSGAYCLFSRDETKQRNNQFRKICDNHCSRRRVGKRLHQAKRLALGKATAQARIGGQLGFFRPEWAESMTAGATQSPGHRVPHSCKRPNGADSVMVEARHYSFGGWLLCQPSGLFRTSLPADSGSGSHGNHCIGPTVLNIQRNKSHRATLRRAGQWEAQNEVNLSVSEAIE